MAELRRLIVVLVVLGFLPKPAISEERFEVTLLPTLETARGSLARVEAKDINNRGEIVGTASGDGRAAFRYRAGRMEDLDPDGRYDSQGLAINRRGLVLGKTDDGLDTRYFRATRQGSIEMLLGGLSDPEIGRLRHPSLNDRGAVVASPFDGSGPSAIYRKSAAGWEPLTAGESELEGAFLEGFNNRGDAVLVKTFGTPEVTDSAAYLYRRNRTLTVIRPMAPGHVFFGAPNDSGAVSGDLDLDSVGRALYYDPEGGLREIHPEGFRHSFSGRILKDGTALVAATRGSFFSDRRFYFTYHPDEGLEILWTEAQLDDLIERSGCRKPKRAHFFPPHVNQNREALMTLICTGGRGAVHFSKETGFTRLDEVLIESGFRGVEVGSVGINDKGQLVVTDFFDNNLRSFLLTPAN